MSAFSATKAFKSPEYYSADGRHRGRLEAVHNPGQDTSLQFDSSSVHLRSVHVEVSPNTGKFNFWDFPGRELYS